LTFFPPELFSFWIRVGLLISTFLDLALFYSSRYSISYRNETSKYVKETPIIGGHENTFLGPLKEKTSLIGLPSAYFLVLALGILSSYGN